MRHLSFRKYSLSRQWWIAFAIALAGTSLALGVSYVSELNRAHSSIESNLRFWAPELADIFSHKDWLRLSKLGRTFGLPPARSTVFREQGRPVFSFPLETEESSCLLAKRHAIQQYGVDVGTLDVCLDPAEVLSRAIASPLFVVTALSLFFIIGFAALLPILSLRRGLATLVDYLAEWSTSAATSDSSTLISSIGGPRDDLEAKLHTLVQDLVKRRLDLERKALRDEIVRDVAHNVNSPIASLAVQIQRASGLNAEERVIFTDRLNQLSGIVAKLRGATQIAPQSPAETLEKHPSSPKKSELISILIDAVIADKRAEKFGFDRVRLSFDPPQSGYGAFVSIHALDFKVVLSNLLNNAYEAIDGSGEINVSLKVLDSKVEITIQDTGRGIPVELQNELFREGFTHGKLSGNGRGLYHAKKTVAAWGGNIAVESRLGAGTKIILTLPLAAAPSWFLPTLELDEVERVVVLDDDPTISSAWRHRIQLRDIMSFTDPDVFTEWLSLNRDSLDLDENRTLFLIDLRLGTNLPTGLDIIERNGLAENAVLVTSDADQESIQKRCSFLGAKLLWKSEIGIVPIEFSDPPASPITITQSPPSRI
jgi:signal transduction histidine kinase